MLLAHTLGQMMLEAQALWVMIGGSVAVGSGSPSDVAQAVAPCS